MEREEQLKFLEEFTFLSKWLIFWIENEFIGVIFIIISRSLLELKLLKK